MIEEFPIGSTVLVRNNPDRGYGKLVNIDEGGASVLWFTSISNYLEGKDITAIYNIEDLRRCVPSSQTRSYVEMSDGVWRIGRLIDYIQRGPTVNSVNYLIKFPGSPEDIEIPEKDVFIRCYGAFCDPIDRLIYTNQESPFLHNHKMRFIHSVLKQKEVSRGLTGLMSARIQLFPHQIRVINRILKDPVQRYLLADEVGLGKTIEAGVILRQTILDKINIVKDGEFRAIIIVPQGLVNQWSKELLDKFYIQVKSDMVQIYDFETFRDTELHKRYDICIIDEAHNIARLRGNNKQWSKYQDLALKSEKLLLLSATPALRHEEEYLAMLNLLEPNHYSFDNMDAFKRGINDRQSVGTFLLGFNVGTKPFAILQQIKTVRQLFSEDEPIMKLTDNLENICNLPEPQQEQIDYLINKIRLYICETCRIYRRLIRTTRESIDEAVLFRRSINQDDLIPEFGYDKRIQIIADFLEEWRSLANITLSRDNDDVTSSRIDGLIHVFFTFIECFGNSIDLLRFAVETRLSQLVKQYTTHDLELAPSMIEILLSEPCFDEEQQLLESMLQAINSDYEKDKYDLLLDDLESELSQGFNKCIIFASSKFVGEEILRRLDDGKINATLCGRFLSDDQEDLPGVLDAYHKKVPFEKPLVLVCDSSGEEGLNLQYADVLIHFDLPWDPNRLEQRIGRFDRIGRKKEVRSTAFIPCTLDPDGTMKWLTGAWFTVLNEGFGIFNESIAGLQFFVSKIMPDIKRTAFLHGDTKLRELIAHIKVEIDEEKRVIREQNFLDSIEAYEDETEGFIDGLLRYDERGKEIKENFDSWVSHTLRFEEEQKRYYNCEGEQYRIVADNYIFPSRYKYVNDEYRLGQNGKIQELHYHGKAPMTLLPIDIWAKIGNKESELNTPGIETYASFSRQQALQLPGMPIFRLGHPFFDYSYETALWDDRGQAYCTWRCIPELPFNNERLFFILDYIIEINVNSILSVLKKEDMIQHSIGAFKRQIDAWFPPIARTIYVDQDFQIVNDEEVIDILKKPYAKASERGTDINLSDERSKVVFQVVDEDRWPSMCKEVRKMTERSIRSDISVVKLCNEKYERATKEFSTRLERLGLAFRYLQDSSIISVSQVSVESYVDEEEKLYSQLLSRINKPDISLLACGVIVLSKRQLSD